jgi:hydrogenase maturation factor
VKETTMIKTAVRTITPEVATRLLETNTVNRVLRQWKIDQYARDMKAGKWKLTHQGMALSTEGNILDGQHRLWAVVESGVTIECMVTTGFEREIAAYIDSGLGRTMADHLRIGFGVHAGNMAIAVARRIVRGRGQTRPTTHEVHEAYTQHEKAITLALKSWPRAVRGVTTVPIATAMARASYHTDESMILRFGEALCEGRYSDDGDDPIRILRNWLTDRAPSASSEKASDLIYAKAERALFAFLRHEKVTTLYPSPAELFPLPEEATTTVRMRAVGDANRAVTVKVAATSRKTRKRTGKASATETKSLRARAR